MSEAVRRRRVGRESVPRSEGRRSTRAARVAATRAEVGVAEEGRQRSRKTAEEQTGERSRTREEGRGLVE